LPKDGCASLYSQVMIDDSSVMYVPSTLSVYSSSSLRHDSYARNSHALRNRRHAQSRPTGLGLAWLGLAWQHGKPRKQQRDVVGLCATPTVSRRFTNLPCDVEVRHRLPPWRGRRTRALLARPSCVHACSPEPEPVQRALCCAVDLWPTVHSTHNQGVETRNPGVSTPRTMTVILVFLRTSRGVGQAGLLFRGVTTPCTQPAQS
jgi:hypothetical protein